MPSWHHPALKMPPKTLQSLVKLLTFQWASCVPLKLPWVEHPPVFTNDLVLPSWTQLASKMSPKIHHPFMMLTLLKNAWQCHQKAWIGEAPDEETPKISNWKQQIWSTTALSLNWLLTSSITSCIMRFTNLAFDTVENAFKAIKQSFECPNIQHCNHQGHQLHHLLPLPPSSLLLMPYNLSILP